ncbi:MAG: hypothetical protein JXA33_21825 [Anaerolineae bacterium]|nr:hypothetical protein [Anaerolineae bacterium]
MMKRWIWASVLAVLGAMLALGGVGALMSPVEAVAETAGASDYSVVIGNAVGYLQTQVLADGSVGGDEFLTIKSVLAIAAANRPIEALTAMTTGLTPLDYLATAAVTYTHNGAMTGTLNAGRVGMLATAVVAVDAGPRDFGGMDLIQALTGVYSTTTGKYGAGGTGNQWWAIVGLAAAQEPVPAAATDYLVGLRHDDGGWGWGTDSDVDTTASVVQALVASGNYTVGAPALIEAVEYLREQQMSSGGWGYEDWVTGDPVLSVDSTAAAIQALAALGYVPATESWATRVGDPYAVLLSFQQPDGSFSAEASGILATAHAIQGLAEAPLPIFGRQQRAQRALAWLAEQQQPDGSWGSMGNTLDAVLAYSTGGYDPATVNAGSEMTSVMAYLSNAVASYSAGGATEAGKSLLALIAAGESPYTFGGIDLVSLLTQGYYSPTAGTYGDPADAWDQAFALLGLAAAEQAIPGEAVQHLKSLQAADGSWSDAWGYSKPDSTGLALQALIAAGTPSTATCVVSATAYLRSAQDALGGWDNANATAYAIQGLVAAGEDLTKNWAKNGYSPYNALATYQKADGPFVWVWESPWGILPSDNLMATTQAIPALLGKAYPLRPTFSMPDDEQNYAGLVIDYTFEDNTVQVLETACVAFSESHLSGLQVLERAGVPYQEDNGFVSSLRGITNPPDGTYYWSYWRRDTVSVTWQAYGVGAGSSVVQNGVVEGWHFVDWNTYPSPAPSVNLSVLDLCGVPSLQSYVPVYRGADPDRMLVVLPRAVWNETSEVDVTLPFGSDRDQDGSVALDWRVVGDSIWTTGTYVHRAAGYFTATLAEITPYFDYEFRATFSDPDTVQYGHTISDTVEFTFEVARAYQVFLPLVVKE